MVEEQNTTPPEESVTPEASTPEPETPAAGRGEGAPSAGSRPRRRGYYPRRRRPCVFCVQHARLIDYKDVDTLRRFLSDRARIEPRRKSGTCAKHQRALSVALKRARHLALLPYTGEHIRRGGISPSRP
ncbi:MAG: 30S ribosomal protein S18 [Dehalococcoidia bacterium]